MWDGKWSYHEVFHSPSEFASDDAVSKGFVRLAKSANGMSAEAEREWHKAHGKTFQLASLSTSLTERWVGAGWTKAIDLPDFVE